MKIDYRELIPVAVFLMVFCGHVLYFKIFVSHNSPFWWSSYVQMQLYFVSFSLGVAFSYGAFSFIKLRHSRTKSTGATAGSAILAFLVWFTSCCGAPLLVAGLGIFGIGVGTVVFPPSAVALLTILLVSLGYLWLRMQTAKAKLACSSCRSEIEVPVVHCGPAVLGPEDGKLYCPCINEGHTESVEIPKHCELPMKYVK